MLARVWGHGVGQRHQGTALAQHISHCPELPWARGAEELIMLCAPPFLKIPFCTQCFLGGHFPVTTLQVVTTDHPWHRLGGTVDVDGVSAASHLH